MTPFRTFICFLVAPSPNRATAFSNSAARMASAFDRSALMVGTVSRESRHASKLRCSSLRGRGGLGRGRGSAG